jgi:hypothetical protein
LALLHTFVDGPMNEVLFVFEFKHGVLPKMKNGRSALARASDTSRHSRGDTAGNIRGTGSHDRIVT